jgi:SAM-dependent methyltransferase
VTNAKRYAVLSYCFDEIYKPSQAMYSFYESLVIPDRPVLELGCGTGRVAIALASKGIRVVGIDISREMISRAKKKMGNLPVQFRRGDIRQYALRREFPEGFGLIMAPWSVLLEIAERDQRIEVYSCALRHLAPGGALAFDVSFHGEGYLSNWGSSHFPHGYVMHEGLVSKSDGTQLHAYACRKYGTNGSMALTFFLDEISRTGVVRRRVSTVKQKYVSPNDTEAELREAGFKQITMYGSFSRARLYGPEVEGRGRQIIVAAAETSAPAIATTESAQRKRPSSRQRESPRVRTGRSPQK